MPENQAKGTETPAITSTIMDIRQQLKYYSDLNSQLLKMGHRLHDTTQPTPISDLQKEAVAMGLLTDLKDISNFLAIENTVLQDTINKLSGLI